MEIIQSLLSDHGGIKLEFRNNNRKIAEKVLKYMMIINILQKNTWVKGEISTEIIKKTHFALNENTTSKLVGYSESRGTYIIKCIY